MTMKNRKLLSLLFFVLSFAFASAQGIQISGKVVDETSSPIIGASVVERGTTNGVITDFNGDFTLNVQPNAVLRISYVGYGTQEINVAGNRSFNIILQEDAQELDYVVVVGTAMRKSDLTGAVSSIDSKKLTEKPVTSINQALQGRLAGVLVNTSPRPGDDASIKIRGINTINGSTEPIYVVDGIILDNFSGGFNSINLNDVESIEVMKDASATALYGSRGSNGVVVITTKKGKRGEGVVSYDGWIGTRSYAKVPKTMGTRDLFELRRDAAINSFNARYPNATQTEIQNFIDNRVMKPYVTDGGGGYVFAQYELDAFAKNLNYNWLDEVTRTGIDQNHSLSFSGGSDRGAFYFSLGYSDQIGMVKNLSDKHYTGRINADYNVKSWLKVGTSTSFSRSDAEIFSNDGVYDKARGANPMLAIDPEVYVLNYGGLYDQNYFNPIRTLKTEHDRRRNRMLTANFINISPIKDLNIRTSLLVDYSEEARFKYTPKDIQESIRYSYDGQSEHTRDYRTIWQWDNSISYTKTFGQHNLFGLFSTSATQADRDYTYATGKGFGTDEFSYYNIGSSYMINERSIGSDFTTTSLMSYVLRANYNYANRYYLTATARYDGSSKFAKGNQWGLFPSFSAAWNITEESFMQGQQIFDQIKLRLGYGLVGNQNIDNFAYLTLYSPQVDGGTVTYVPQGRRGTPDITWESQRQINVGADFSVLKNRLRFTVDYFNILNDNLLMTRSLPLTSGFSHAVENIGAIENKGVEFTVDADVVNTSDFSWNISANISADKNKVTKLYGDNQAVYNIDADRNLQKQGNLFIGESRNTIYIWKTGGIAQASDMDRLNQINWAGRNVNPGDIYPLDYNGDKVIDEKDRIIVGSPDPKFYGGFATDLNYKGISLNAVFNYSYGSMKLSPYYESLIGSAGRSIASVDLVDRWTPENTGAQFPRPIYNDPNDSGTMSYNTFSPNQMDFSVQDASYLRLSTLTLSYTLPSTILNTIKFNNVRVYSTLSNAFVLTKYKGYDPETGDWYPPTRMLVFGLNVSL